MLGFTKVVLLWLVPAGIVWVAKSAVSSSAPHNPTAFFCVPKGSKPLCVGVKECLCCCCSSAGRSSLLLLVWFAAAVRDLEQGCSCSHGCWNPKVSGLSLPSGVSLGEICHMKILYRCAWPGLAFQICTLWLMFVAENLDVWGFYHGRNIAAGGFEGWEAEQG